MADKFTPEQHAEYGDALKSAADAMAMMQALLANTYGRDCRERSLAERANNALLYLRSAMDSLACAEIRSDSAMRLYFGERIAKTTQPE